MNDLEGAEQLVARFKAISKTETMMRRIVIRGVAEAKHLAPHKTRNLSRTIRVGRVTATSGEIVAGGSDNVGYAAYVERGTRPHIIRPKVGRRGRNGGPAYLAWGGNRRLSGSLRSGSSATHFAQVVHHPGTRAQPYLVPGLQAAARKEGLDSIVERWNRAG